MRFRWAGYVVWLNVTSQGTVIYAGHAVTSGRALGRAGYVARIDNHNDELYDLYSSVMLGLWEPGDYSGPDRSRDSHGGDENS
jgi:hypothetical protein